jgi:hypothetical protein
MSNNPFTPRKVRKIYHSDNPKTARNRETEASKQGFEAAELKAKNTHRVAKHRQLTKLHRSREWQSLSDVDKAKRQEEVVQALEETLRHKIKQLEIEWERPDDHHIDDNEFLDIQPILQSAESLGDEMDLDRGTTSTIGDGTVDGKTDGNEDTDGWEDEPEDSVSLLNSLHKRHAKEWQKKLRRLERRARWEAVDRN